MQISSRSTIGAFISLAVLLSADYSYSQTDKVVEQLQALNTNLDHLTSSNAEILRRLDRLEQKTLVLPSLRLVVDQMANSQQALLQQMQQLRNSGIAAAAAAKPTPVTPPRATPAGPKLPMQVDIGTGRMEGDMGSTVVLVMFSDFQCGYCQRFVDNTLPILRSEYIDSKKVRYALRDFTLSMHHDAPRAANAARCAEDQGKYWEMARMLNGHQNDLTSKSVEQQAKNVGLDMTSFTACMNTDKHAADVKVDVAKGNSLGISGTPSFAIGYAAPGSSQVIVTKVLVGNRIVDQFRTALNETLKSPIPKI